MRGKEEEEHKEVGKHEREGKYKDRKARANGKEKP